jgi:hypothetical protein
MPRSVVLQRFPPIALFVTEALGKTLKDDSSRSNGGSHCSASDSPTSCQPAWVRRWTVRAQVFAHGVAVFNHPLRGRQDQDTFAQTA